MPIVCQLHGTPPLGTSYTPAARLGKRGDPPISNSPPERKLLYKLLDGDIGEIRGCAACEFGDEVAKSRWPRTQPVNRVLPLTLTIHLRPAGAVGKQFDDVLRETLQPVHSQLEQQLKTSLATSFGPDLKIGELYIDRDGREILIRIDSVSYVVKSCGDFEKALTRFVFHLEDLFNKAVRDRLEHAAFRGRWFPAPPLIRVQSDPPERHASILRQLQQPLVTLILGTILGSALIPWIQSRSNLAKVRHDERIKLALSIIDQNGETNSKLVTLKTSLALFAKDHLNPADTVRLAKQQQEMRERYDLQYLAFDAQAWWWYWAVQMKAQLGALATPKEATRLQN